MRVLLLRIGVALLLVVPSVATAAPVELSPEDAAFFEREVRPVLVQNCLECHGDKKQHAGLALTSREAALKGGDSGAAVVPGKAEASLLIAAVRQTGDASSMPPEGKLKEHEIAALAKWVDMGLPWPSAPATTGGPAAAADLWSLRPVQAATPPTAADPDWNGTDIDRFLGVAQEAHGIRPTALADKRTLLRRVTFDLTGLPPTREEIAAFLADESPEAFSRVVERLLASPHYGERWGRHWLDVVRYADTAGDGADYPVREAYLYRNYVIRAFNADKPFDLFVREQLAGDVLARQAESAGAGTQTPEQYAERVIATGYLAVGKRFGYNDNTEFVHLDISDTIDTVGRSLLGLSVGCARCHDHKYDPVSAADYYALYGIFASSKFAFPGGEELKRPRHFVPLIPPAAAARLDEQRAGELAAIDAEILRLEQEHATLDRTKIGGGADYGAEQQALGTPPGTPWITAGPNQVLAEAQSPFTNVHPAGTRGVRVRNTTPHEGVRREFPNHTAATSPRLSFNIDFRNVDAVDGDAAYRFYAGHGAIVSLAFEASVSSREFHLRNGGEWERLADLETGAWYNLAITFDLATKTYSGTLTRHGAPEPVAFEGKRLAPNWDGIINTFVSDGIGKAAGTPPTRDLDNLGIQNAPFVIPSANNQPTPEELARIKTIQDRMAGLKAQREQAAARSLYEVAYAVAEGQPMNARIQKRGEPDRLGDEVPRRNLEILGGQPVEPADGSGRLRLAEWLTQPSNPLTARVMVNRVWQGHFGAGLVRTASDFGSRGEKPSHPELLDHLTNVFLHNGWSIKSLHRMILATRAYRLAASDDPATLDRDPQNVWLGRFPRHGLDAESLRDSILALSGELDRTMPAGHPFPPVDSWSFTIHYPFKAAYDSKHRSVYQMVQRSQKHPYLSLFDAADPNVSTSERFVTTTPTQALYLMNSPFVHEQSRALARRLLAKPATDGERIAEIVEGATGRVPPAESIAAQQQFLERYRTGTASLSVPPEQREELAWAALARVFLTSNAFLFVE